MIKKIVIFLLLLLFCMGIVCASDLSDFKFNSDFNNSTDFLAENNDGSALFIIDYEEMDYDVYFKNSTNYNVTISDNIAEYADDVNVGCCEVVEKDGELALIEFYAPVDVSNGMEICYNHMKEFNELNGLKPVNI